MRSKPTLGLSIALIFVLSVLLMACGDMTATSRTGVTSGAVMTGSTPAGTTKGKVVVASKDFTESIIVAEMYAAVLENAGIAVERKMNLGATAIAQAAIVKGDISLYPEYTGTALGNVLKVTATSNDPKKVYDQVAQEYSKQFKLALLEPAPMNNTNGVAVTKEVADKYKLKNLSDLAPIAKELRFASNAEFIGDRSAVDGLKSLQKTYGGFDFKETKQVDIKLRYQALLDKNAEACVAFGTDGQIAGYGLVLMNDDKNNFPPYQVVPVIREDILAAYPNAKDILNKVSAKLTNQTVSDLNWQVDGPTKKEAVDVAKDYLKAQGMIK